MSICSEKNYQGDHDAFIRTFKERVTFMRDHCHSDLPASASKSNASIQYGARMSKLLDSDMNSTRQVAMKGKAYEQETFDLASKEDTQYKLMMEDMMKNLQKELAVQGQIQQESIQKNQDIAHNSIMDYEQTKRKLNQLE